MNSVLFVPLAFLAFTFIQFLFPLKALPLRAESLLRNWRSNLSLGLINYLLLSLWFSHWLFKFLPQIIGCFQWLELPHSIQMLFGILLLDFTSYVWHLSNHKIPWLWRFHSLHHSDTIYDTSTALRFHPIEVFFGFFPKIFVLLFFGIPVEAWALFNLLYTLMNFFEHCHMEIPTILERTVGWIFILPSYHIPHHLITKETQNSNYGTIFSFWDRLTGTFKEPNPVQPIVFGLKN